MASRQPHAAVKRRADGRWAVQTPGTQHKSLRDRRPDALRRGRQQIEFVIEALDRRLSELPAQAEDVLSEPSSVENGTACVLYIATRRDTEALAELFESMRLDMISGTPVELIVDRRRKGARFGRQDRREHREQHGVTAKGWARIVVDRTVSPRADRITGFSLDTPSESS